MSDDPIAALHARIQRAVRGEERQHGAAGGSPVRRYLDPERHEAEHRALRHWPLPVAAAGRVARPGDWLGTSAHGVPVLLARAADGVLRAFANVCRHRGAGLVREGDGGQVRERFVCPYHSWTYASDGRCVGRPHEADFTHAPREAMGLAQLPCTERLGLVWVVATPGARFDFDAYFGPLGAELQALGFDEHSAVPHERRFVQPSNWKLVCDANLEAYHFAYAHRDTLAGLFHDNLMVHDSFGAHQRIVLPRHAFAELAGVPATLEGFAKAINTVYFFFPATLLLWEGDHLNGFCLSPLRPDACQVEAWTIVPGTHLRDREPGYWQRNHEMFWTVIDEDMALAASMQRGLDSGANEHLCFGTSEFACGLFEDAVERLLLHPRH